MDSVIYSDKRDYPEARYVILYVCIFLAFVIMGTFFGKMFYSSTDTVSATVRVSVPDDADLSGKLFALAKTEISTAIELTTVFFAAATLVPTLVRGAVIAYRGAALGWACALLNLCTDTYIASSVVCYAVASIVITVFASESSGKRPETGGINGKIRYIAGFLVMSAVVFAVELVPTVLFARL